MDIPQFVRKSAQFITSRATHVRINPAELSKFSQWVVAHRDYDVLELSSQHPHYADFTLENIVRYYFVVDTLNFCFWHNDMEYADLTGFLKGLFQKDPGFFSSAALQELGPAKFGALFGSFMKDRGGQLEERFRLVLETALVVGKRFKGSYLEVVREAEFDALKLLDLLTANWKGFQDHSVYKGRQVGFYKRAQILVGDLKEAILGYKKAGCPKNKTEEVWLEAVPADGLANCHLMTGFPDYRVPQVLRHFGVLEYSPDLSSLVDAQKEIPSGSEMELEIRGANVAALVDLSAATGLTDIQIDWILWQWGEKHLSDLKPHHRTLTIYY